MWDVANSLCGLGLMLSALLSAQLGTTCTFSRGTPYVSQTSALAFWHRTMDCFARPYDILLMKCQTFSAIPFLRIVPTQTAIWG